MRRTIYATIKECYYDTTNQMHLYISAEVVFKKELKHAVEDMESRIRAAYLISTESRIKLKTHLIFHFP